MISLIKLNASCNYRAGFEEWPIPPLQPQGPVEILKKQASLLAGLALTPGCPSLVLGGVSLGDMPAQSPREPYHWKLAGLGGDRQFPAYQPGPQNQVFQPQGQD